MDIAIKKGTKMMKKKESSVHLLLKWAGKDKYYLYLSILCSLISGLCTMIPYYGVYQVITAIYQNSCTKEVLFHNSILIFVSIVLRFVLFGCSGGLSHKGAYRTLYKVRCMIIDHMAKVGLGVLSEHNSGAIKTILNEDIEKLELFLAHHLPELIYYMCGPIAVFLYLCFVNLPLALVSLIPLILAMAVMGVMFSGMSKVLEDANQSLVNLNSVIIEYISGMKVIKAFHMGSNSFLKYKNTIEEENKIWNKISKKMGPPYAAYIVITECGLLFMVPIGGFFFLQGSLSLNVLLLFLFIGSLYLTELRPLQELGSNFAKVLHAVIKTKEILDIPIFEGGDDFPKRHAISLNNVCFAYPSNEKEPVLINCNLEINHGEKVALVGKSGAGKSTIIQLIARFYDTEKGSITIGGMDVQKLNYEQILENVSIVFQKTFLTRDSVFENIRMGTQATLTQVREAAKKAQIDSFIMSLPNGYETKVGSYGTRFSGGEKQRIAIARAILKNAPILILDEATSAADPENQVEIDKAIQNLCEGKTVIIVAHRLSALKICDRIAVVENHAVSCIGCHEDVLKESAYYKAAWESFHKARTFVYQMKGGLV
ncbi:ATP-binding cassette subfamily B protein [Lachnotalea glycerini]|uniref:ATP-binding cassette subfamily B protein n=2 Tax=Lachnotalea glycerini TaxID=1763509 RepID=A0A318EXW8_9FIRM|nr:ABC transporter ATP-binding protein [Lachnotalea glycerini]PXV95894.1 ATP-binding cassette subfamily B protein [Lachnotalea glycerini]